MISDKKNTIIKNFTIILSLFYYYSLVVITIQLNELSEEKNYVYFAKVLISLNIQVPYTLLSKLDNF